MSSTSRRAGPTRPSPLSRLHSSPGASFQDKTRSGHYTYAQRQAGLLPESTSPTSPCFVHSHLERYSQLDDRLRAKLDHNVHHQESNRNGTEPDRLKQINTQGQAGNRAAAVFGYNSEGPSPRLSPHPANGQTDLGSQQDNNRNSVYAPSPSDVDDAEDGGSLTRQLAETATGVREMSKQLGRTKVRSNIQSVLIVTKARDNRLIKLTREVAVYLMRMKRQANGDRGMIVYVDAQLRTSKRFDAAGLRESNPEFFHPLYRRRGSSSASMSNMSGFVSDASGYASRGSAKKTGPAEEGQLRYWTSEMCSSQPHLFDMVVTLGGDGTVLFTSWLFQRIVPPVLPFALGSLGFLTNFDFADYAKTLDKAVDDGIRVNLRMRFTCTVYRAVTPEQAAVAACKKRKAIKSSGGDILLNQVDAEGWEALEGTKQHEDDQKPKSKGKKDKEIMCFSTRPVETFEVLNDLVVDRGPSPYVSLLELFGDDHHLTTVQADGLCVATPTGSTAYSLSAGGSLVHPGIPALLISPICPHTLSFRPMLLPDGMELRVCVPYNSRSTAWASFDGRGRVELKQGDHIKIAASKYPFPTICRDKQSTDWFNSISRTLRWNEREKQKSFVVVEEDRAKPVKEKTKQKSSNQEHKGTGQRERGSLKDQEAPLDESPRDDAARIAASKKEADMGATRMGDLQEDISKKQERFRSGRDEAKSAGPLDGGDNDDDDSLEEDDDEEDEEEDEEEEGFDIDDVSEEKTASSPSTSDKTPSQQPQPPLPNDTVIEQRPQYSTKRPSHLLTSLLSMTSQGSADGYEDPGLKSGVDTPDRFGAPYSHTGPSPKRNEAFAQSLDHGLNEALHEQQKRKMHASGRLSSYRQDNTADIHSSDVDSDQTDATRTDASTYQGRLKVHPPGQPGIDPLSTSPKTGMHQRARSRSRSRSRSMSRSKVGSSSRSRSRTDYMISAQMETPTDSEKDTEQEDMLRPSRSQRRRSSSGASDMKTPRSSSIMTRHRYHDPEPVAEENEEDDGDGEGSKTKAFAFYGEDESESGQSDVESVG